MNNLPDENDLELFFRAFRLLSLGFLILLLWLIWG